MNYLVIILLLLSTPAHALDGTLSNPSSGTAKITIIILPRDCKDTTNCQVNTENTEQDKGVTIIIPSSS